MSECIAVLCNAFGCTDLEGLEAKLAVPGPCTASWKAGEFAGRCRTCQKTPHAAFCLPCLLEGNNHAGHDISVHVSSDGGCCDCGDPRSCKLDSSCALHTPTPRHHSTHAAPKQQLPPSARLAAEIALVDLCTSALDALTAAASATWPEGTSYVSRATPPLDAHAHACSTLNVLERVANLPRVRDMIVSIFLHTPLADIADAMEQQQQHTLTSESDRDSESGHSAPTRHSPGRESDYAPSPVHRTPSPAPPLPVQAAQLAGSAADGVRGLLNLLQRHPWVRRTYEVLATEGGLPQEELSGSADRTGWPLCAGPPTLMQALLATIPGLRREVRQATVSLLFVLMQEAAFCDHVGRTLLDFLLPFHALDALTPVRGAADTQSLATFCDVVWIETDSMRAAEGGCGGDADAPHDHFSTSTREAEQHAGSSAAAGGELGSRGDADVSQDHVSTGTREAEQHAGSSAATGGELGSSGQARVSQDHVSTGTREAEQHVGSSTAADGELGSGGEAHDPHSMREAEQHARSSVAEARETDRARHANQRGSNSETAAGDPGSGGTIYRSHSSREAEAAQRDSSSAAAAGDTPSGTAGDLGGGGEALTRYETLDRFRQADEHSRSCATAGDTPSGAAGMDRTQAGNAAVEGRSSSAAEMHSAHADNAAAKDGCSSKRSLGAAGKPAGSGNPSGVPEVPYCVQLLASSDCRALCETKRPNAAPDLHGQGVCGVGAPVPRTRPLGALLLTAIMGALQMLCTHADNARSGTTHAAGMLDSNSALASIFAGLMQNLTLLMSGNPVTVRREMFSPAQAEFDSSHIVTTLDCLRLQQGLNPVRRQTASPPDNASRDIAARQAFILSERSFAVLGASVLEIILTTPEQATGASDSNHPLSRDQILSLRGYASLIMATLDANTQLNAQMRSAPELRDAHHVLSGNRTISFHWPLTRLLALVLSILISEEARGGAHCTDAREAAQMIVSWAPSPAHVMYLMTPSSVLPDVSAREAVSSATAARAWTGLAMPLLEIQACVQQRLDRLWQFNENSVSFYTSVYPVSTWSRAAELDLLTVNAWLASQPADLAVCQFLCSFVGMRDALTDACGIRGLGSSTVGVSVGRPTVPVRFSVVRSLRQGLLKI